MSRLSEFDVLKMKDVRCKIESELKKRSIDEAYSFNPIPNLLCQYRSLKEFVIDYIENDEISFTPIDNLNDMFDSSIYHLQDHQTIGQRVDDLFYKPLARYGFDFYQIHSRDELIEGYRERDIREAKIASTAVAYLGTCVSCFSRKYNSPLMWSHYANSSKGICIGYDFNLLKNKSEFYHSLFPVSYVEKPINQYEIYPDGLYQITDPYDYRVEIGTTIATLQKPYYWDYEDEWRFIYTTLRNDLYGKHIPKRIDIKPSSIYFGYHFLKNFFVGKETSQENCEERFNLLFRLLNICENNSISMYVMDTDVGSYDLVKKEITPSAFKTFFLSNFPNKKSQCHSHGLYHILREEFKKCFK